jgi:glycerol-3-phosphate O-acyltransferase 3/4
VLPHPDLDGLGDLAADVFGRSADVFMEGVDSIVDDNFWKCFEPNKPVPWNWNLYLGPLWAMGVVIRYLILFPIRVILLFLGWVLFALGMLIAHTLVPPGDSRRAFEHKLISFQCGVFTLTWGAVIRFHGTQVVHTGGTGGKPKTNCVFVANHTSMIDVIILQQNRCFSLVGQKHKGVVKFLQEVVLGCLQCVWFDRGEIKDRAVVAQTLTDHAKDVTRNPLLVFPEGTCVNNEYCIQFKKGVFELGVPIVPVAIRYHKMFVDPFWNSRSQSFVMHLVELMTSWCLICDVYYMEPQTIREGETGVQFASRVKAMIAKAGKLKNVEWDGYMKYWKPSKVCRLDRVRRWGGAAVCAFLFVGWFRGCLSVRAAGL